MSRGRQPVLLFSLLLILASLSASTVYAYVEDLQSVSLLQFHNRWGDFPEVEWYTLTHLYKAGDHEGALELLAWMESTGEFDVALVLRNRAVILKDLARYDEAAETLAQLVLRAGEPRDRLLYAWTLYQVGDYGRAEEEFGIVTALLPDDPWGAYGLARTREALGKIEDAAAAYEAAVALDERFAAAYYHLGWVREALGDFERAIAAWARAVALDPYYTELYMPLARLHEGQGNIERAWRYSLGAALRYPNDPEPQEALDRLVEQYGPMLRAQEEAENRSRRLAARHTQVTPLADPTGVPLVRVGLVEGQERVELSSGGPVRIFDLEGRLIVETSLEGGAWALHTPSGVRLTDADGGVIAQARGGLRLEPLDRSHTFILYDLIFGQGYFFASVESRQYRGSLEILQRNGGLTVVNEVNLEEYLYSVVPSEMYATMPMEALKVQAIAARTYTLRHLGRYASRGFDVLGSVASSEYRGVDREHPRSTEAVNETRGLVLRYGNVLIDAVYTSDNGGYSASGEEVWGGNSPYLQGQPDVPGPGPEFPLTPAALEGWLSGLPRTYAGLSGFGLRSTLRWVHPLPASRLQAIVDARADIGTLLAVVPRERAVSGHVRRVELVGTKGTYEVTGDRIRSVLGGIKSNLFRVEAIYGADGVPTEFLFIGGGAGHGVGLSQLGAAGRAMAGQSVEEIIQHYYPGARISKEY